MTTATAILRDNFLYDASGFKAKAPGANAAFARASIKELRDILTLDTSVNKDRSLAYYRAQLVHYGMRPYSRKGDAKKNLLKAVSEAEVLEVPATILQLEEEMKREWNAQQRQDLHPTTVAQDNATISEGSARSELEGSGTTLKRKASPFGDGGQRDATKKSKTDHKTVCFSCVFSHARAEDVACCRSRGKTSPASSSSPLLISQRILRYPDRTLAESR